MKKLIGFALCLVLVLMAPAVQGATVYTEGYFEYQVQDGGIVICGYFGNQSEVTVPASIAGYPVSVIGAGAFSDATHVDKINLPDTIMTIEEGAIRLGQTVVYKSNTDDAIEREPQPTPTAAPSAGGDSGTWKDDEDRWDEEVYAPSAPETMEQITPAPSLTPAPSEMPQVSAEAEETPQVEETASATAPEVTVEPEASVGAEQSQQTADQPYETESAQANGSDGSGDVVMNTLVPDGTVESDDAQNEQAEQDKQDKLTVKPIEKKQTWRGWIWIVLGAAAGCAAVLTAILIIRKKNGM